MLMTKNEIRKLIRETLMIENENSTPNIKKIQDMLKKKSGNFRGEQIFPDVFDEFRKEKILPDNKEARENLIERIVKYILENKIKENLINQAHEEILSIYPELKKEISKKFPKSKEKTLTEGDDYESFYNTQKQQSKERFGSIGSVTAYGDKAPDSGTGGILADTGFTLAWELSAGPIGDIFGIGFGIYDAVEDHQQRNKINNYLEKNKDTLTDDQKENLQDLEYDLFVSESINVAVVFILTIVVVGSISTGGILGFVAGAAIGAIATTGGSFLKFLANMFKGAKKVKPAITPVVGGSKTAAEELFNGDDEDDDDTPKSGGGIKGSLR